jgi:hypothetical protein
MRADLEDEEAAARRDEAAERDRLAGASHVRSEMARSRKADLVKGTQSNGRGGARTGARN